MDSTQTHFMFLSASHGRSEINLINCEKWTSLSFDNLCWDEDQGVKISGTPEFISLVFQRLIPSLSNFVNSFNKPKGKFWTSGCSSSLGLGLLVPSEVVINQNCPSSPCFLARRIARQQYSNTLENRDMGGNCKQ